MTTKDAIKHLSYKISYCKEADRMWVDGVNVDALEIAVRAMAKERKKGKWIPYSKVYECRYNCSLCGYDLMGIHESEAKFCPNCGADMREEESHIIVSRKDRGYFQALDDIEESLLRKEEKTDG